MRETRQIMGMPVTVELADGATSRASVERVFEYFTYVDSTFSTYKEGSEISRVNRGELSESEYSKDMREIFRLAEETKRLTNGYFDIHTPSGTIDPSGIVKGWAINQAAELLRSMGHEDLYVEAGGDIQSAGMNGEGNEWTIGIRNPFEYGDIVKVICPRGMGIATSGTAIRGRHIYDPLAKRPVTTPIASLTVIGPDVYEADRFATAAFAMGERGISFIASLDGFEAYQIDTNETATMTQGFQRFVC